eukprot:scaffold65333_cov30-Tisochrysis_lutea.AAC.2
MLKSTRRRARWSGKLCGLTRWTLTDTRSCGPFGRRPSMHLRSDAHRYTLWFTRLLSLAIDVGASAMRSQCGHEAHRETPLDERF